MDILSDSRTPVKRGRGPVLPLQRGTEAPAHVSGEGTLGKVPGRHEDFGAGLCKSAEIPSISRR